MGQATPPELTQTAADELVATDIPNTPLQLSSSPPQIGRYVYLGQLGAGAMGEVIAVYDPTLDRKVALKIIVSLRRDDPMQRQRMVREAQAMAKLTHPNVVTVHEVGEEDGCLFVAMEYVRGGTLRAAVADCNDWRQVLKLYRQAGLGLAAAHDAGLVHRDFKPENVLVGDDGRVRVGDFGLARGYEVENHQTGSNVRGNELEASLTLTGALLGTPAYMSPEQFSGQAATAASDQFSFCVALWEGLYGARPFQGQSLTELSMSVGAGVDVKKPPLGDVPMWLFRVVARGLEVDPSERWPSMHALLFALGNDPTTRRRRWMIAGTVLAAIAGVWGAVQFDRVRTRDGCLAAGHEIEEVWNGKTEAGLRKTLSVVAPQQLEHTLALTHTWADGWAESWSQLRTQQCLDTQLEHRLRPEEYDRATKCLYEHRSRFAALLSVLEDPELTGAYQFGPALANLPRVEDCARSEVLSGTRTIVPTGSGQEEKLRAELRRTSSMGTIGRAREGLARAQELLPRIKDVASTQFEAEANLTVGELARAQGVYETAAEHLRKAIHQAYPLGLETLAADAAIELISVEGAGRGDHEAGIQWAEFAELLVTRLGEGEDLRNARRLLALAEVHIMRMESKTANELQHRALTILEARLGLEHPMVADALVLLGRTATNTSQTHHGYLERAEEIRVRAFGEQNPTVAEVLYERARLAKKFGEAQEAGRLHRRAIAIQLATLGTDHPALAKSYNSLGLVERQLGDLDEAEKLLEKGLHIRERSLPPDHRDRIWSLNNLGILMIDRGKHEQAVATLNRALTSAERAFGPNHNNTSLPLINLADAYLVHGDYDTALSYLARVAEIRRMFYGAQTGDYAAALGYIAEVNREAGRLEEASDYYYQALEVDDVVHGPEDPETTRIAELLAETELERGKLVEAKKLFSRALRVREEDHGADHPMLGKALMGLGRIAREEEDWRLARQYLERVHEIRSSHRVPATDLAATQFELAKVRHQVDADREHARELATLALTAFTEAGPLFMSSRYEVQTWLDSVSKGR